jgi:hypothetical protein
MKEKKLVEYTVSTVRIFTRRNVDFAMKNKDTTATIAIGFLP